MEISLNIVDLWKLFFTISLVFLCIVIPMVFIMIKSKKRIVKTWLGLICYFLMDFVRVSWFIGTILLVSNIVLNIIY